MFKQVKSALFWYYLYKFRRKVILISFLLLISFFANAIYADLIQYLTLKNKLEYLEIVLFFKWFIIIFNILFSIYIFLTFFKKTKDSQKNNLNKTQKRQKEKKDSKEKNKFSKREEEFLEKDLKNKADKLVER